MGKDQDLGRPVQLDRSKHRTSPNRMGLSPVVSGVNPELPLNSRTRELATDQSIAARHLLYHPNKDCLDVIRRCVDGMGCIMDRLKHTGDKAQDLLNDEILISMSTRLMANGGIGRLPLFNEKLEELVRMKSQDPQPDDYTDKVQSLAELCRNNMSDIMKGAVIEGLDGAHSRQAVLAFMGDLGGLERHETGFGQAYKGPLCDPQSVYEAYISGLCDAYRKLDDKGPATKEELAEFSVKFEKARANTSIKGGGLSAPRHTKNKKGERAPLDWVVVERNGLLGTGSDAEAQLRKQYPDHKTTLLNPAWPSYQMSPEVIVDVVEPVTGHISGTFGEMATTMNMFCGTPLETMTLSNPSGIAREEVALRAQKESISALVAAALVAAGYHSAAEFFQPMSTFSTQATYGGIGPEAVENMINHAKALREYATQLSTMSDEERPETLELHGSQLTKEELFSDKNALEAKAQSLEEAATKAVDMISMLQGGGTIATLDVNRVMAQASSNPNVVFDLYSSQTQLEELGLNGQRPELKDAQRVSTSRASLPGRRMSTMDPFDEEEEELVAIETKRGADQRSIVDIPFELITDDPSSSKKVLEVLGEMQKTHSPKFVIELAQTCLSYAEEKYPRTNMNSVKSFIQNLEKASVQESGEKKRSSTTSLFRKMLGVIRPTPTNEKDKSDKEKGNDSSMLY